MFPTDAHWYVGTKALGVQYTHTHTHVCGITYIMHTRVFLPACVKPLRAARVGVVPRRLVPNIPPNKRLPATARYTCTYLQGDRFARHYDVICSVVDSAFHDRFVMHPLPCMFVIKIFQRRRGSRRCLLMRRQDELATTTSIVTRENMITGNPGL